MTLSPQVVRPRGLSAAVTEVGRSGLRWVLSAPGRLEDFVRFWRRPLAAPRIPSQSRFDWTRVAPHSTAYLALEPEARWFVRRDLAIAYTELGGTLLAVGGPLGPGSSEQASSRWGQLLGEFRDVARDHGYARVLVFGVAERDRESLANHGFDSVHVGTDARLDLDAFDLATPERAGLRYMHRRACRLGVRFSEVPEGRALELEPLYSQWLSSRPVTTRMTSMVGSPQFDSPLGRRYFAAWGPGDALQAFVTCVPSLSGQRWSVDVMARRPDAVGGAVDYLITEVAFGLRREGAGVLSLGACPLSRRAEPVAGENVILNKVMGLLFRSRVANAMFRFQSLELFKSKFSPRWEASYLAAWPRCTAWALYSGCRVWGLFGERPLAPAVNSEQATDSAP